jgi:arsenate reductase (thioredoxin)
LAATYTIVFVCLHGSGKSLIAAEHFRQLAAQRGIDVLATAAGINPDSEIPPKVVKGLLEDGIDVGGQQPRRVTQEELANAWHVVSFGCDLGDVAPPGLTIERWDDVPAVSEDFNVARDVIVARLPWLLAACEGH